MNGRPSGWFFLTLQLSFSPSQSAEKDEFEHQQKELEKICNPIMTKLYQNAGGMPGGFSGAGDAPGGGGTSSGPTIEEVDWTRPDRHELVVLSCVRLVWGTATFITSNVILSIHQECFGMCLNIFSKPGLMHSSHCGFSGGHSSGILVALLESVHVYVTKLCFSFWVGHVAETVDLTFTTFYKIAFNKWFFSCWLSDHSFAHLT